MLDNKRAVQGPTLNLLDEWCPGCWRGAALKLCDRHTVETEESLDRYPEQWMFVLWRPMAKALPFMRPDCWGHSNGHPWASVAEAVGDAPLYLLPTDDCLWSAWIDLSLVCDRYEPWFTGMLQTLRDAQRQAERERYVAWYGCRQQDFQHFLSQVVGGALTDTGEPVSPAPNLPLLERNDAIAELREQRLPAGPREEGRVAELAGGAMRIERVDGFGGPLERYEVDANWAQLLCAGLHQRTGLPVPDVHTFLLLLPRCFAAWFDFKHWLTDQGISLTRV